MNHLVNTLLEKNKTISNLQRHCGDIKWLSLIRDILALFLILWGINPKSIYYPISIYITVLCVWLIFAFLTNVRVFTTSALKIPFLISCAFVIYKYILSQFGYGWLSWLHIVTPSFFFMFWYYYGLKDLKRVKWIVGVSFLYWFIINLVSIPQICMDSRLSLLLADQSNQELATPFLANYAHVYLMMFLAVVLLGIFKYFQLSSRYLILGTLFYLSGVMLILLANYVMAVLFWGAFSFLMICFCYTRNPRRVLITCAVLLLLAVIIIYNLSDIFYFLSNHIDNENFSVRFSELGNLFSGKALLPTSDIYARVKVYETSICSFLENPLIGTSLENGAKEVLGGHSEILDCLASYGIIGGVFFVTVWIGNFISILRVLKSHVKNIYFITVIGMLIMFTFNTGYMMGLVNHIYLTIPFLLIWVQSEFPLRKNDQTVFCIMRGRVKKLIKKVRKVSE